MWDYNGNNYNNPRIFQPMQYQQIQQQPTIPYSYKAQPQTTQIQGQTYKPASSSTSSSTSEIYQIHILCMNCQKMIYVDDIDKHSLTCFKVTDNVLKIEKNLTIQEIDNKLQKLREALNQYLNQNNLYKTQAEKNKDNLYGNLMIDYINKIATFGDKFDINKIKSLKIVIDEIQKVTDNFNGPSGLLIYFERVKILGRDKYNEILRIDQDQIKKLEKSVPLENTIYAGNTYNNSYTGSGGGNSTSTMNSLSSSAIPNNMISYNQDINNKPKSSNITASTNNNAIGTTTTVANTATNIPVFQNPFAQNFQTNVNQFQPNNTADFNINISNNINNQNPYAASQTNNALVNRPSNVNQQSQPVSSNAPTGERIHRQTLKLPGVNYRKISQPHSSQQQPQQPQQSQFPQQSQQQNPSQYQQPQPQPEQQLQSQGYSQPQSYSQQPQTQFNKQPENNYNIKGPHIQSNTSNLNIVNSWQWDKPMIRIAPEYTNSNTMIQNPFAPANTNNPITTSDPTYYQAYNQPKPSYPSQPSISSHGQPSSTATINDTTNYTGSNKYNYNMNQSKPSHYSYSQQPYQQSTAIPNETYTQQQNTGYRSKSPMPINNQNQTMGPTSTVMSSMPNQAPQSTSTYSNFSMNNYITQYNPSQQDQYSHQLNQKKPDSSNQSQPDNRNQYYNTFGSNFSTFNDAKLPAKNINNGGDDVTSSLTLTSSNPQKSKDLTFSPNFRVPSENDQPRPSNVSVTSTGYADKDSIKSKLEMKLEVTKKELEEIHKLVGIYKNKTNTIQNVLNQNFGLDQPRQSLGMEKRTLGQDNAKRSLSPINPSGSIGTSGNIGGSSIGSIGGQKQLIHESPRLTQQHLSKLMNMGQSQDPVYLHHNMITYNNQILDDVNSEIGGKGPGSVVSESVETNTQVESYTKDGKRLNEIKELDELISMNQNNDPNTQNQDEMSRLFYSKCLALKMKLPSRDVAQHIPVVLLYKAAIDRGVPPDQWESFIKQSFSRAQDFIDVTKIKNKKRGGLQNKLAEIAKQKTKSKLQVIRDFEIIQEQK